VQIAIQTLDVSAVPVYVIHNTLIATKILQMAASIIMLVQVHAHMLSGNTAWIRQNAQRACGIRFNLLLIAGWETDFFRPVLA